MFAVIRYGTYNVSIFRVDSRWDVKNCLILPEKVKIKVWSEPPYTSSGLVHKIKRGDLEIVGQAGDALVEGCAAAPLPHQALQAQVQQRGVAVHHHFTAAFNTLQKNIKKLRKTLRRQQTIGRTTEGKVVTDGVQNGAYDYKIGGGGGGSICSQHFQPHVFLILSSLFGKLRDARDKTLVCKNRKPRKIAWHP